jgi:3-oxoacyl-[acyl-carrier protein] reductase
MQDFKNKVALVTGASRGIGKAVAQKLARCGADVIINYSNNDAEASTLQAELSANGTKPSIFRADISNFEAVEKMVLWAIQEYGKIDILVNNAGIGKHRPFIEMSHEQWRNIIDVNLTGTFNVTKHVVPHMIRQQTGKIVNVSSIGGLLATDGQCAYAASKAGVMAFTRVLGKELIPYNINVNSVAPGLTDTDRLQGLDQNLFEDLKSNVPALRIGKPEEIANLILFLCSEDASYIVGQTYVIDGGLSISPAGRVTPAVRPKTGNKHSKNDRTQRHVP